MLEANRSQLESVRKVTEELLPENSKYGVYQEDGKFLYGNIEEKKQIELWQKYQNGSSLGFGQGYMKHFQRDGEVCIVVYHIRAEFVNPVLRKYLPGAPELFLLLSVVVFVVGIAMLVRRYGRMIKH